MLKPWMYLLPQRTFKCNTLGGFHIAPIILFLGPLLLFKAAMAKRGSILQAWLPGSADTAPRRVLSLSVPQEEREVPSLGIWRTGDVPSMAQPICKGVRGRIRFSWGKAPHFPSAFSLCHTLKDKPRWVTYCYPLIFTWISLGFGTNNTVRNSKKEKGKRGVTLGNVYRWIWLML